METIPSYSSSSKCSLETETCKGASNVVINQLQVARVLKLASLTHLHRSLRVKISTVATIIYSDLAIRVSRLQALHLPSNKATTTIRSASKITLKETIMVGEVRRHWLTLASAKIHSRTTE